MFDMLDQLFDKIRFKSLKYNNNKVIGKPYDAIATKDECKLKDLTDVYEFQLIKTSYPRIADKIEEKFQSNAHRGYINSIMIDSVDGTRQREGFPLYIADALLTLSKL